MLDECVESDGCWYRVVCCDACRCIPKLDQAAIAKAELSLAAPFVLSPYHSVLVAEPSKERAALTPGP